MSSEIPKGWEAAKLDDVADFLDSEREPINSSERVARISGKAQTELYPYYGATGQVGWIDAYRSEGEKVLLGEDAAPFLDSSKDKAYLVKGHYWVNNHAHILQGSCGLIDNRFLCYQLNMTDYHPFVSGSTRLKLTSSAMKQIPFLVAPHKEQTRIVEKLEELLSDLDAGVAELKAAQKKLAQYRQSLLKAAVEGALTADWRARKCAVDFPPPFQGEGRGGDGVDCRISVSYHKHPHPHPNLPLEVEGTKSTKPVLTVGACETGAQLLTRILTERRQRWEEKQLARFKEQGKTPPKGWQDKYPEQVKPDTTNLPELPEGWVWASLSQVGWLDRGKSKHRPRNAPFLFGGPYPFIQTGDIREAETFINHASSSYSEAGLAQSRLWPKGTMCITIAANIGKTAILDIEACFPDSIVGFLSASDHVSVDFIEYFMRSVQQKLEAEAPATAQKNINLEILERVCLPLPPMNEQVQIVRELRQLLESASLQENAILYSLKQSAAQRKNILKSAFSGQLVPQDPHDEPASVLLERIRAERAAREATGKRSRK